MGSRPLLPPSPLPPQRRHPQTRPGAAGDFELGADVRGWGLEEFQAGLLDPQAGILPNSAPEWEAKCLGKRRREM